LALIIEFYQLQINVAVGLTGQFEFTVGCHRAFKQIDFAN